MERNVTRVKTFQVCKKESLFKWILPMICWIKLYILHSMQNRIVLWRQAFLLGLVICILTYFVMSNFQNDDDNQNKNPSIFVLLFFLIVALLYFEKNYQNYHLYRFGQEEIEKSVHILRRRIST